MPSYSVGGIGLIIILDFFDDRVCRCFRRDLDLCLGRFLASRLFCELLDMSEFVSELSLPPKESSEPEGKLDEESDSSESP